MPNSELKRSCFPLRATQLESLRELAYTSRESQAEHVRRAVDLYLDSLLERQETEASSAS